MLSTFIWLKIFKLSFVQLLLWASISLFPSTALARVTAEPLVRTICPQVRSSSSAPLVQLGGKSSHMDSQCTSAGVCWIAFSTKTVHISEPLHWLRGSVGCRNRFHSRTWNTSRWHQQAALGCWAGQMEIKNICKKVNCRETSGREGRGWSPDYNSVMQGFRHIPWMTRKFGCFIPQLPSPVIQYNRTQIRHIFMRFLISCILHNSMHSFSKGSTDQTFVTIVYYKPTSLPPESS